MPYNPEIEARIKKVISRWKNTAHKNMFGGVCHLLKGNISCGVYKDFLILRLGEERAKKALDLPCVRPFGRKVPRNPRLVGGVKGHNME